MLDISQIQNILQHRYPFLLIDRILELEEKKKVKAQKCITVDEEFFQGHFPGKPVMPGMLVIEAMAQASAFIIGDEWFTGFLTGIYKARFKKPVVPGDTLILESEFMQRVKNLARVKATAKVNGEIAVKAELGFIILKGNLSGEK